MRALVGVLLVIGCGPSASETRTMREARYATRSVIVQQAVRDALPTYEVSGHSREMLTAWKWVRGRGEQVEDVKSMDGTPSGAQPDDYVAYRFIIRIGGPGEGPYTVTVDAEAYERKNWTAKNQQLEAPGWLVSRRDGVSRRIYEALKPYVVRDGAPAVVAAPPIERPAPPPDAAVPPVEPLPAPVATLENMIVEGDLGAAEVEALLAPMLPELATCLGTASPYTIELMFLIADDALDLRTVWNDGRPMAARPPCIEKPFRGVDRTTRPAKRTEVYVVVKAAAPGLTAPAAPAPPVRAKDMEDMFCHLDTLSGADKLPVEKRQEAMTFYARNNIRHPAAFALAAKVPTWAPQDTSRNLTKAIKVEGVKKCPLQRW